MNSNRYLLIAAIGAYTITPLAGVLLLSWDWRSVMVFYWLGNISAGLAVVIDMVKLPASLVTLSRSAAAGPAVAPASPQQAVPAGGVLKLFMIPFFCFHYGTFTLIHGIFLFAIINGGFGVDVTGLPGLEIGGIIQAWLAGTVVYLIFKLVLPGEKAPIMSLWNRAYGRIIALHLSIVFGVFVIMLLQLPAAVAVLLILINFVIQLLSMKQSPLAPEAVA